MSCVRHVIPHFTIAIEVIHTIEMQTLSAKYTADTDVSSMSHALGVFIGAPIKQNVTFQVRAEHEIYRLAGIDYADFSIASVAFLLSSEPLRALPSRVSQRHVPARVSQRHVPSSGTYVLRALHVGPRAEPQTGVSPAPAPAPARGA